MIDTSPSSLRILAIMLMGVVWFWLVIDTIMNQDNDDE
jgi:hypothetical protein